MLHPDGSGLRRLTQDHSFAGSPTWSADGKQIVCYKATFADVIQISDPRRLRAVTQIVAVDLATGVEKVLTEGAGEKWSPRWLAEAASAISAADQKVESSS